MHYDLQPYEPTSALDSGPAAPPQPTVIDTLRILRRRGWIVGIILAVSLGVALLVTQRTPRTWQSHAQLILQSRAQGSAGAAANADETVDTQLAMIRSLDMAQRTIILLKNRLLVQGKSPESLGVDAPTLEKQIGASGIPDTNLIDLSVDAPDPQQAALLANGLVSAFIIKKTQIAQRNSDTALNSLSIRAARAKTAMENAEMQQLRFSKGEHIVDAQAQSSAVLSASLAADNNATAARQELALQQTTLNSLSGQLNAVNAKIGGGDPLRNDAETIQLQTQLNDLESQRAAAAAKVTPAFPNVLNDFDAKIKDVRDRYQASLRGTLAKNPSLDTQKSLTDNYIQAKLSVIMAQAKLNGALQVQQQLKGEMQQLPDKNLASIRLSQNTDRARQLYNSIETALNASKLDRDMVTGNVQLIQAADVPEAPISPNRTRNLLIGGGIGLALSVLAVMLLEQMDRRVRDPEQLRRIGGQDPIAGTLPRMSRGELADLRRGELAPATSEALNLAAINLSLLMRDNSRLLGTSDVEKTALYPRWAANGSALGPVLPSLQNRVIMVTSALPGEGKSVTTAALARAMARGGKRVILVDADLRRPAQGQMFPADKPLGLADVLAGRTALVDALQPSEIPNLLVLHCGQVTDSPTSLLSRPRLTDLMRELRDADCTVLIDTPACAVVSDAFLLAPHADCVLYVVGMGLVDETVIQQTRAALSAAGPQAMAYFVNRAPSAPGHAYQGYYAAPVVMPEDLEAASENAAAEPHSTRPVTSLWENQD